MCMCGQLHVFCVYLNVEAKRQPLVSSSILLSTLLEKGFTDLSSPSRLNWLASEPLLGSTCFHFPSTGNYKHAPPFLVFLRGFWGIWTQVLMACLAGTLLVNLVPLFHQCFLFSIFCFHLNYPAQIIFFITPFNQLD